MQLISNGINALSMANYADRKGDYYVAFFGLSIGLERLTKLVLVADYVIDNDGIYPPQTEMRKFGHHLKKLLDQMDSLQMKYEFDLRFARPVGKITENIIDCLDSFADASRGRYANFNFPGDPLLYGEFEPLRKWWADVAETILKLHFYGTKADNIAACRSKLLESQAGNLVFIMHTAEDGSPLHNLESASYHSAVTACVQKYGRFYSVSIARWVSEIFEKLTLYGCYKKGIPSLFAHCEHFETFLVSDEFLKTRKRWPLV